MTHKHRAGPIAPVFLKVALTGSVPAYDIAIGDLIAQVSGKAVNAANWTWDTDLATTQAAFMAAFVGISASRSIAGSTDARDLEIQVETQGEFDVDLSASLTLNITQLLVPAKNASSNLLQNAFTTTSTASLGAAIVSRTMAAAGTAAKA